MAQLLLSGGLTSHCWELIYLFIVTLFIIARMFFFKLARRYLETVTL